MLDRRVLGDIPAKPHTVFEYKGASATEFVFTRNGFSGGFSILYNKAAPTAIKEVRFYQERTDRLLGELVPHTELPVARRHLKTAELPAGQDLIAARTALYRSTHCRVSVLRGSPAGSDYVFSNGDGDELYFVYDGSGVVHSMFGKLPFKKHDYILIPRGVPYYFDHRGELELFLIEGDPNIEIPGEFRNPFGQLKLEAPYTHRDFASPAMLLSLEEAERFKRVVTLRNGQVSEHLYSKSPVQTIGWDGSVYPITFNIANYLPKTGKIHLPPNLHMTFKAPNFVVCSFVPRMVDYLEGAIPCPYPHANVECDEILYYVSGNFTSRKGVGERSISHHPAGMPHGPQPGNYLKSVGAKFTNELAVMLDTWEALQYTQAALAVEDSTYVSSWQE